MTEPTESAESVLQDCEDAVECQALVDYMNGINPLQELDYEDVFYPLRHHHTEGLALDVSSRAGGVTVVWGPGDFIYAYRADRPPERYPQIDPGPLWRDIQNGFADVDVVVVGDDTEEAEDA